MVSVKFENQKLSDFIAFHRISVCQKYVKISHFIFDIFDIPPIQAHLKTFRYKALTTYTGMSFLCQKLVRVVCKF